MKVNKKNFFIGLQNSNNYFSRMCTFKFSKICTKAAAQQKVAVLELSSARSENNTKCSLFITDKLWIMVCYFGTL